MRRDNPSVPHLTLEDLELLAYFVSKKLLQGSLSCGEEDEGEMEEAINCIWLDSYLSKLLLYGSGRVSVDAAEAGSDSEQDEEEGAKGGGKGKGKGAAKSPLAQSLTRGSSSGSSGRGSGNGAGRDA